MANDGFKKFCDLTDELGRRRRNLKSRIRRKENKIKEIFDPSERQRIEDEIKPLRSELKVLNAKGTLMNLIFFEAMFGGKTGMKKALLAIENQKEVS